MQDDNQRKRSRRQRRLGLVVVGMVCLAAPGIAQGRAASVAGVATGPTALLAESRLLVSSSIGGSFVVHVWQAPLSSGGQCQFATSDKVQNPAHASVFEDGSCSPKGTFSPVAASHPLLVSLTIGAKPAIGSHAPWVPPFVNGNVARRLGVTHVMLTWNGGSKALTLRDGVFAGGGAVLYKPPLKDLPYKVVAYDAKGRAVAKSTLSSASLELMSPKQFASTYASWSKSHGHS